jgi:sRNA-binding carbon storage regulator CsrA
MLTITRTSGEAFRLDTDSGPVDIHVRIRTRKGRDSIELSIVAPPSVRISREELLSPVERASLESNLGAKRSFDRFTRTTRKDTP